MLDKLKMIFKKNNLIITLPIIILVFLVIGNGYLMYQNHQIMQKIDQKNTEIKKVSNDYATKYKKVAKRAKQEFKATHTDPLDLIY